MSGTTKMPRSCRCLWASGVVGPLAPSTTTFALMLGAFSIAICFSSAAGIRIAPAERSAHLQRLAGDDSRRRVPDMHAVGVHHPRHDLLIGVDVGRGDVLLGADRVDDFRDVAAGEGFELAAGHPRGIADDTAFP